MAMHQELDVLRAAVRQAGQQALKLAVEGFETHIKKDRSPVTTADLAVNQILRERLLTAFPHDAWLSEETPDDPRRLENTRVWVIDPIDGTKYFMRGVPQYAISVALVESHHPVVSAVFNPATDELFSAVRGMGAWLNGQPIHVTAARNGRPVIFVNPPALERGVFRAIEAAAECRPMGSIAYTLALVAAGRADATLNVDGLNEWDVAGGVLLIEEAGGAVMDRNGSPLSFNQAKTTIRGILAADTDLLNRLLTFTHTLSR
ncbi:MAG TPA: 3'(2'),5'-bisphosphate nucleotidase CysQ [Nitrospiraceae bacterium]|nr:3'(2'),5'-bisphosphate nucleotidase CysQ [Nitrospiraceae bacterium]